MTATFEHHEISACTARKLQTAGMRKRLNEASAALRALDRSWAVWTDTVRQVIEERNGVTHPIPIEEADALLDDPEYVAALHLGRGIDQVTSALQHVLDSFAEQEPNS
jgi:hypothetical protein